MTTPTTSFGFVALILVMACDGPRAPTDDSTAEVTALPLGAAASELTPEEHYRDHADEYTTERTVLSGLGGRVVRVPGVLRIVPRSGDTVVLRDSITDGDAFIRYVYASYQRALDAHVVDVRYYEGGGALVVSDSTGRKTYLADLPRLSPDSVRFAVVSFDLEAGYEPNRVEIWRPGADSLVSEFAHDFGTAAGPDSAVWRSADTLSFVRTRYVTFDSYERTPSRLIRRNGAWRIEPPPR